MNTSVFACLKLTASDLGYSIIQRPTDSQNHRNAHLGKHILCHWPRAACNDAVDLVLHHHLRQLPRIMSRAGYALTLDYLPVFDVNQRIVLTATEVWGDLFPISGYGVAHNRF